MNKKQWINGLADAQVRALACQHGYKEWNRRDGQAIRSMKSWLQNDDSVNTTWLSIRSSVTNQKSESAVA